MRPVFTLTILMTLITCPALASEKSDRLAEVLRLREQYELTVKVCNDIPHDYQAETLVAENPYALYGLNPQSKEWPEVVKIYNEYFRRQCGYMTPKEYLSFHSDLYVEHFTEAELDELIAFYSGSTGKKLIDAHVMSTEKMTALSYEKMALKRKVAEREFAASMAKLVKDAGLAGSEAP